ncbi:MAG: PEGA domain-containing protein [Deltaproteobacteria bacterium]|nr:MAG: PEGA domain-containing protein [Deltaproteobacteria bacterium]
MKKPIPFGKYYLMDRIAVGGMAEVFKAKTFGIDGFEKVVALKRILPNIAEDEEFIMMFSDEAKIAVKLSHANIVQIFDLGQDEGSYFIAMEYIHGRDLRTIFDRSRRKGGNKLDPKMVAYVMARVCEGLDYAHRKKDDEGQPLHIVHRDVSPQNILLSYEGDVKIIDFGVAKAQNKMSRTQAGILKGKFAYMSPEQIQGLPLDQRSDIFALGIVFYELLTAQRLFVGESDFHTLEMIRNMKLEPPSSKNPAIPPALDEITMKALSRDLNQRYTWASEMHEDLQRFLYSNPPIYTRQDLAASMRQVFQADIDKEKQRSSAYEPFFHELRNNPQAAETPSPQQGFPSPQPPPSPQNLAQAQQSLSYTGNFPQMPQNTNNSGAYASSGQYSQPTGHVSQSVSHPQPTGNFAPQPVAAGAGLSPHAPTPPPVPQFSAGGSPYGGGHDDEDIGDSTMMDPSGKLLAAHLAGQGANGAGSPFQQSGAQPPPMPASPYAAPPQAAEMGQPPTVALEDLYDDGEEESDTIIDLSMTEDEPGGKSKTLLWVFVAVVVVALGVGGFLFLKPSGPPPQPQFDPGKLHVMFKKPTKDVQFFIDKEPFPAKRIKRNSARRYELLFPKKVSIRLTIKQEGFIPITQPVKIEPGDEMQTPFLTFEPNLGTFKLTTNPKGAVVFIDGRLQRAKTPAEYSASVGPHQVQVMKQGRKPWEKRLIVKQGKGAPIDIKLKRTKAKLTVVCRAGEGKAWIYINRRRRGRTPMDITLNPMRTYKLEVRPLKYRKRYKAKVFFPLSPTKRISVDCVKPNPKARGIIKLFADTKAKIWINGRYVGITPKRVSLKPGSHKFRFVNLKTKRLFVTSVTITSGQNPDFFVNRWNK